MTLFPVTDFYLKRGDIFPKIRATLKDPTGAAIPLAGTTVTFRMRLRGSAVVKVDAEAAIIDADNGRVEYAWAGTDTDTSGLFNAEWSISFSGDAETVPNNGYVQILIVDTLETP